MICSGVNTHIRHGGDLQNAIKLYGGNPHEWLDLSTGISPWSYPTPTIEESAWRELPPSNETLIAAAAAYYGCDESLITCSPGSQLSIRLLPQFLESKQSVAIPMIGYQEHANSWRMAGHTVKRYRDYQHLQELLDTQTIGSAVVINPNNPTAEKVAPHSLIHLSKQLSGILLVDEAFSDIDKPSSVCVESFSSRSNIIVLKSVGKFFGLAGARVGFVIGSHSVVEQLNQLLSPWSVSGPSFAVVNLALRDTQWQAMQRQRIAQNAKEQRLALNSLSQLIPGCQCNDQSLFFSIFADYKSLSCLHIKLAEEKIWTRIGDAFTGPHQQNLIWLRLSLAGDNLTRLSSTLETIRINQVSILQNTDHSPNTSKL